MPDKNTQEQPKNRYIWGFLIVSGSLLSGFLALANLPSLLHFQTEASAQAQDVPSSPEDAPTDNSQGADIYVSPFGADNQPESSSAPTGGTSNNEGSPAHSVGAASDESMPATTAGAEVADIYVSPFGSDGKVGGSPSGTRRADRVVFVAAKGNDKNTGSQRQPFRSLTKAINQALRLQDGNPNKAVLIQIANGTYSRSSGEKENDYGLINIPKGVSVRGSGDTTILLVGIRLISNSSLESLKIRKNGLTISGTNANDSSVNVKNFTVAGTISINNSSPNLSNIKVFTEGFNGIFIGGNARFQNLEIYNQKGEVTYSDKSGAIYIQQGSAPLITGLKLNKNEIGIKNEGNPTLKDVEISGNRIGIENYGEITITNLVARKNTRTAICNKDSGTILIEGAKFDNNPPKTRQQCPSGGDAPIVVPDISGNYGGVTIR